MFISAALAGVGECSGVVPRPPLTHQQWVKGAHPRAAPRTHTSESLILEPPIVRSTMPSSRAVIDLVTVFNHKHQPPLVVDRFVWRERWVGGGVAALETHPELSLSIMSNVWRNSSSANDCAPFEYWFAGDAANSVSRLSAEPPSILLSSSAFDEDGLGCTFDILPKDRRLAAGGGRGDGSPKFRAMTSFYYFGLRAGQPKKSARSRTTVHCTYFHHG